MFWVIGYEACGILDPSPGIKYALPTLECEVLTTGLPGESLQRIFWMSERWKKLICKWMDSTGYITEEFEWWRLIPFRVVWENCSRIRDIGNSTLSNSFGNGEKKGIASEKTWEKIWVSVCVCVCVCVCERHTNS